MNERCSALHALYPPLRLAIVSTSPRRDGGEGAPAVRRNATIAPSDIAASQTGGGLIDDEVERASVMRVSARHSGGCTLAHTAPTLSRSDLFLTCASAQRDGLRVRACQSAVKPARPTHDDMFDMVDMNAERR